MDTNFGYRDVIATPTNRGPMLQSPTGLQLSIDGSFVVPLRSADPSLDPAYLPPDGTTVQWVDGVNLMQSAFTRETGWVSVSMVP